MYGTITHYLELEHIYNAADSLQVIIIFSYDTIRSDTAIFLTCVSSGVDLVNNAKRVVYQLYVGICI